jgi:hypothetical protein
MGCFRSDQAHRTAHKRPAAEGLLSNQIQICYEFLIAYLNLVGYRGGGRGEAGRAGRGGMGCFRSDQAQYSTPVPRPSAPPRAPYPAPYKSKLSRPSSIVIP